MPTNGTASGALVPADGARDALDASEGQDGPLPCVGDTVPDGSDGPQPLGQLAHRLGGVTQWLQWQAARSRSPWTRIHCRPAPWWAVSPPP